MRKRLSLPAGLFVLAALLSGSAAGASAFEVPALGLTIETVTPELAAAEGLPATSGVIVRSIHEDRAAAVTGVVRGDIIVEMAGLPVGDTADVADIAKRFIPSEPVEVSLIRSSNELRVTVLPNLSGVVIQEYVGKAKRRKAFRRDSPPPTAPDKPQPGYSIVKVFYGTNRNNTGQTNPKEMYGVDRGTLVYGSCDVTLPLSHQVGELEAPSLVQLEFSEDPTRHIVLASVHEQKAADFYRDVAARFTAAGKKSAFVFVHGYNVSFEDAARRTAQLAYDLRFAGAPVFFSWPSQASYFGYPVDETNAEFARSDLRKFIRDFARTSGAEKLFLIAHSMGNRALTGALSDLFKEDPTVAGPIREVILAAPDIDADVFKRDIAPALSGNGRSVTLYASSADWALKASKKWHGYPRAGDSGEHLVIVPSLVTIDASSVKTDMFGHGYFADAPSIVADISAIFEGRNTPSLRGHLEPVEGNKGRHWKLSTSGGR